RPLGHRDKHDVHDPNAADDQGDCRDASEKEGERIARLLHGLNDLVVVLDSEVIGFSGLDVVASVQ
ncbi:hypothetical protein Q8G50_32980, partial [Klebsiella pneumoniae]